ncbi:MAG: Signal peptidase I S [Firmicutes bacterium ADurb.Bin193]|nr:MAG: Signal peptidase I S [Firmicutes bacterium ADurb.Bin193]
MEDNNFIPEETTEEIEVTPAPRGINWKKEIFEWSEAIIISIVIAIIIKTFIFTIVLVDGPSMENTLHTGDRLFVYRLGYTPKNGDIVVFKPERNPNKPFIKRVIATPGQTIDIDYTRGLVMIDGKVLDEPYIKVATKSVNGEAVKFPVTVPEGYFFAMGDNRGNSHDSRNVDVGSMDNKSGLIKNESVMGKAIFRIWPLSKFGLLR